MALSDKARKRIEVAVTHRIIGKEISDAIDAGATPATHVADVVTADASDLTTAEALANANKDKINEILAALQAAGLMD